MTTTQSTSIYTPSLSSPTSPLSCSELAHIILTSFSKLSAESRHLVSLILQSVYDYTDASTRGLIDDDDLKLVSTRSDLVMAVASRLEVDLKNQAWSGDLVTDVKRMYNRIIFKLIDLLIGTAGNGALAAVNAVRSTLGSTRHYLATSSNRTIERDIAITAHKYDIAYTREATAESDEIGISSVPQGPLMAEVRAVKLKTKLKKLWGKKGKGRREGGECIEMYETDSCNASEGEASDSGVSMGECDSDGDWDWDWDWDEVGVAL